MKKLAKVMRKITNMQDLDFICRKLFSNLTTDGKTITKTTLSAPFDKLVDQKSFMVGVLGLEPRTSRV